MRRQLLKVGVCLAVACTAQIAAASIDISVNDDLNVALWNKGQSDGPFLETLYQDSSPGVGPDTTKIGTFLSFCVENGNGFFIPGTTYNVDGLSNLTHYPPVFVLGDYTAWVYTKFLALNLPTDSSMAPATINGLGIAAAMNAYQQAIWAGMTTDGLAGSIGTSKSEFQTDPNNSTFSTLGIALSQMPAGWTNAVNGDIKVINMYNPEGDTSAYPNVSNWGQDQLVQVPEPVSAVIWGAGVGVAGFAALCRRKRSRGRWTDENRYAILWVIEGKR